eukprot:scaffold127218_cov12-Tisochrysis_lutea.AAC.1
MPVAAPPPDAPAPVPSLPPSTQRGSASGAAAAAASRPASMSGTPGRPVIFVQQSGELEELACDQSVAEG